VTPATGFVRMLLPVNVVAVLPVLAAGFAVPQFVPQILKVRRTGDTAGLSGPWAVLTGVNNTAWFGYFAASHYWFALIPSSSAALLGSYLGVTLQLRAPMARRSGIAIGLWTAVLGLAAIVDPALLGTALTGAFLVQVVPAVAAAYRTPCPTGIARGTWLLILGEVSCWAAFGAAHLDGPLLVLGTTGVTSSLLMLQRARNHPRPVAGSADRSLPLAQPIAPPQRLDAHRAGPDDARSRRGSVSPASPRHRVGGRVGRPG
jgi:hypothetical protein